MGYTDQWEILCPDCGDDQRLDYASSAPEVQKVRGPYATEEAGTAALEQHSAFTGDDRPLAA